MVHSENQIWVDTSVLLKFVYIPGYTQQMPETPKPTIGAFIHLSIQKMFLFSFALLLVTCSAGDKPSILPPWISPTMSSGKPAMDRSASLQTKNSPDVSSLNKLVSHMVVNYNTTLGADATFKVDFSPPVTEADAILQILEEMEESFLLVSDAKVVLDDTGFTVICNGFVNSTSSEDGVEAEERVFCGGVCLALVGAAASSYFSSWF